MQKISQSKQILDSKLTFNTVLFFFFLKRKYLSSVVDEPKRFYVNIFYVACLLLNHVGGGCGRVGGCEAKGQLV